jgi:hypothetical protein
MSKTDITIQRWMYWSNTLDSTEVCPKCKTPLYQEYQSYLCGIKYKDYEKPTIISSEGGHFCPNCPIVVLDIEELSVLANAGNPNSIMFAVFGIVDFNRIPEEKKHIPLGTKENPTPIVGFLNDEHNVKQLAMQQRSEKDELCHCDSGKEYKKCCLLEGKFYA